MRLTQLCKRRRLVATVLGALALASGCRRAPYIDQSQPVPPATLEAVAARDEHVQQAQYLEPKLPLPMPRVADPRTTANPETQEIWAMTLEEAIRIGLDNSEVVRVIALGAQGIPVGGFEPVPLSSGAGSALGAGNLQTVYDPAIQETQIAAALSAFDANIATQLTWGRSSAPFNNAIAAGAGITGAGTGPRFPVVFDQDTANFIAQLSKRAATGATMAVAHNIQWLYSNSAFNVFPSAYTVNTQLQFTQPLLGGSPQTGPSGLEANRAPIVIARLNADNAVWRFKGEIMTMVRSIEQQYWALAHQQVRLWAADQAFEMSQSLLDDALAKREVGHRDGSAKNVADAQVQLESARTQLIAATNDVLTTERQLRNILGLPPADNRRIVPVTEPSDARIEPAWESSLAQMVAYHPDIVQAQLQVRVAELQLVIARNQLLPVLDFNVLYQLNGFDQKLDGAEAVMTGSGLNVINPLLQFQQRQAGLNPVPLFQRGFQTWQVGFTFQMPLGFRGPLANSRQAQYALLRQRAYLQQTVHDRTHALARFFLEVDANYKLYKASSRLKEASWERLRYDKARYDSGDRSPETGVTLPRLVNSINEWTNAIAQEALYKSTYNTSIAVLEEAKGTLLAYDNIAIAEGPWPRRAYVQALDQQAAHRRFPVGGDGPYVPEPMQGPATPDPVNPVPPPDMNPSQGVAPMPFPVGPLGPPPRSMPPQIPAGEANVLSERTPPRDARLVPANGAPALPPLPPPGDTAILPPPSAAANNNDEDEVPVQVLPPLPTSDGDR